MGYAPKFAVAGGDLQSPPFSQGFKIPDLYNRKVFVTQTNNTKKPGHLVGFCCCYGISLISSSTTFRKLYAQDLAYNANGNISSMIWKNTLLNANNNIISTNKQRYDFTYDGLNRLDNSVYSETDPTSQLVSSKSGFFNEDPEYDLNGNIAHLTRTGNMNGSGFAYGTIDDLTYHPKPNSNQIDKVTEGITAAIGHNSHFIEGSVNPYSYDANGNTTFIPNKNSKITYNYLNLPSKVHSLITLQDISYLYDASGNKLQKTFNGVNSYYRGNVLKVDGKQIVLTGEGRAVLNGTWGYEYHLKDHLGNTRVSFTADNAKVLSAQYTDYYPFGLKMTNNYTIVSDNKYLYNGKELQDDGGLDWYDYGAQIL